MSSPSGNNYLVSFHEMRRQRLEKLLKLRRTQQLTARMQSDSSVHLTEGVQCSHCNQAYEIGSTMRKCAECGDTACVYGCPCTNNQQEGFY